jgi:hypothetical protein
LGRYLAQELNPLEIDHVVGGYETETSMAPPTQYTEITGDRRESDTIKD